MKRLPPPFALFLLFPLFFPATVYPDYRIVLQNGGDYTTPHYWRAGIYLMSHISGGVMGIEENAVRNIEQYQAPDSVGPRDVAQKLPPVEKPQKTSPLVTVQSGLKCRYQKLIYQALGIAEIPGRTIKTVL